MLYCAHQTDSPNIYHSQDLAFYSQYTHLVRVLAKANPNQPENNVWEICRCGHFSSCKNKYVDSAVGEHPTAVSQVTSNEL